MNNDKAKERLKRQVSLVFWCYALILTAIFGWLKSKGIDLLGFISSVPAHVVLQSAISLYFASWAAGLPWDTGIQLGVYVEAPNRGTLLSRDGVIIIVMLAVVFGLLCWAQSVAWFALLLLAFLLLDAGGRCIILRTVRSTIEKSESHYRAKGEYTKLETLKWTDAYMSGNWILVRYSVGFMALIFLGLLMFVSPLIDKIQELSGGLSNEMIMAIAVLCYVLILEGWQWHKRLELRDYAHLLEGLDELYTLVPKEQPPSTPA